ncbi:hypothetical protein ACFS7Z_23185 [Pontibacter toksunensis]|uniref:DUF4410 domain-containing protein n=1 Tax=Pontibacter toksunensis TaxID=1332631 RepID=A0ABW6BZP3_9BACT
MKKLLPFALLFASFSCISQEPMYTNSWELNPGGSTHEAPQKKDNTIIIQTSDSYEEALRNMVAILTDKGFGMQTIDKELGVITTTGKGIRGSEVALIVQVRDGETTTVHIRGGLDGSSMTIYGVTEDAKYNVEYRGMKGSPIMRGWEEMYNVAKNYPGASITYASK